MTLPAITVAMLDLVLVVRSVIAGVLVSFVALTVSPPVCLATVGFFVVYRLVDYYLLVPKIIGDALRSSSPSQRRSSCSPGMCSISA